MITSLNNFAGVQLETDITVITLDDNLIHNYSARLEWEKDNSYPIGIASITLPYDEEIEKYWSTYTGAVVIHANLNNREPIQETPQTIMPKTSKSKIKKEIEEDKIRLQNDQYNYSYIGKISRFKQEGQTIEIFLEDVGWKFMQKVPDTFRKTYIAGQTLDNAFQAICEFMGVEFAYSIEELSKYNFSTDGYSIEKDGKVIEDTPSILEEFNQNDEEEEENKNNEDEQMANGLTDKNYENSGLIEQNQQQNENNQTNNQSSNQALNQVTTNQRTDENTNQEEQENPKVEQYQAEFDEKIKDLFKGNTLYNSNVSDPILNYDWITVQPSAQTDSSSTSSISTDASTTSGDSSQNSSSSENNQNSANSSNSSNSSSSSSTKNGWVNGQYYINGKISLSNDYINSLPKEQALAKRASGKNTYTSGTLTKLLWRSLGQRI